MRLNDWWHDGGQPDKYMRFGLRDQGGVQRTSTIQFNPGETAVDKWWGALAAGQYAVNARSETYPYGDVNQIEWNGSLFLF